MGLTWNTKGVYSILNLSSLTVTSLLQSKKIGINLVNILLLICAFAFTTITKTPSGVPILLFFIPSNDIVFPEILNLGTHALEFPSG